MHRANLNVLVDRCLGNKVAPGLRAVGIPATHLSEVYADDGQSVQDTDWLSHAANNGMCVFTQDLAIWENPHERQAVMDMSAKVFCLASSELSPLARALVFGRHILKIGKRVAEPGGCFWVLGLGRAKKLCP